MANSINGTRQAKSTVIGFVLLCDILPGNSQETEENGEHCICPLILPDTFDGEGDFDEWIS